VLNKFRIGIIIYLLRQLKSKHIGKTSIQKLIYFLQELGVNLKYKYKMYHYGPYCFELSNDLDLLSMLNVISIKDNSTIYGYSIKLGDDTDKFLTRFKIQDVWESCQDYCDKLLQVFGSCTTRNLELYATMHFVGSILKERGKNADANAVIHEVKFLKPKYSQDELENAYQYLSENIDW